MCPAQPVLPPAPPTRRLMLAITGRLRRPRVVPGGPDFERWARAWARRWWVVEAENADLAREAIERYMDSCLRIGPAKSIHAADFGIVETGRNGPGGPEQPPWAPSRRQPRMAARRRSTSRTVAAAGDLFD